MLGAMAAKATRPVINGELLRCRTSMGNATVDIRLPNMETEEPNIRVRKLVEPDSRIRAVRDRASKALATRPSSADKARPSGSAQYCRLYPQRPNCPPGQRHPSHPHRF